RPAGADRSLARPPGRARSHRRRQPSLRRTVRARPFRRSPAQRLRARAQPGRPPGARGDRHARLRIPGRRGPGRKPTMSLKPVHIQGAVACAAAVIALATAPARAETYHLDASPKTVAWGNYDASAKPVLTIKSGDTVVFHT